MAQIPTLTLEEVCLEAILTITIKLRAPLEITIIKIPEVDYLGLTPTLEIQVEVYLVIIQIISRTQAVDYLGQMPTNQLELVYLAPILIQILVVVDFLEVVVVIHKVVLDLD